MKSEIDRKINHNHYSMARPKYILSLVGQNGLYLLFIFDKILTNFIMDYFYDIKILCEKQRDYRMRPFEEKKIIVFISI